MIESFFLLDRIVPYEWSHTYLSNKITKKWRAQARPANKWRNKMKKSKGIITVLVLFILAASIVFATGALSEKEADVIIGMSGGYKPYTFVDESGQLTGFDVDVWKEIGQRLDISVAFETSDFSGLFGKLDTKQITTIANQITVTPERQEKYLFSDPYVYYGAQLVVHKDNDDIVDLETLKGKKVGVALGSNYESMIRDFDINNEIEIITYEDYQGSLQDVSLGRIDAVLNDRLAGLDAINESGFDIKFGGEPVEELYNAFPFVDSEENEAFISEVNEVIGQIYADGTLEAISVKWFNVDISKK